MNTRLVALGIIALFVLVVFAPMIWFGGYITSGYGGISSKINSIEHEWTDHPHVDYTLTPTIASLIPDSLGPIGATGVRMELGQPQYTGDDLRYSHHIEEESEEGVWARDWEVRIAYFDLSFTITTDGTGFLPIGNVIFWIELEENQFDVFTAADEVEAYILEVVTKEPVELSDAVNVKVSPSAGGFSFDMDPMESVPIPYWMRDAGYQGVLSELKHIRFSVTADSIQPTQIVHMRYENGATWRCEVRALVFGFWEVLSPYDPWDFIFYGWLDWLDDIFQGLEIIVGLAVGIVLSIVILRFVPDKRLALAILLVTWAVVIIGFGFLEMFV